MSRISASAADAGGLIRGRRCWLGIHVLFADLQVAEEVPGRGWITRRSLSRISAPRPLAASGAHRPDQNGSRPMKPSSLVWASAPSGTSTRTPN